MGVSTDPDNDTYIGIVSKLVLILIDTPNDTKHHYLLQNMTWKYVKKN